MGGGAGQLLLLLLRFCLELGPCGPKGLGEVVLDWKKGRLDRRRRQESKAMGVNWSKQN